MKVFRYVEKTDSAKITAKTEIEQLYRTAQESESYRTSKNNLQDALGYFGIYIRTWFHQFSLLRKK